MFICVSMQSPSRCQQGAELYCLIVAVPPDLSEREEQCTCLIIIWSLGMKVCLIKEVVTSLLYLPGPRGGSAKLLKSFWCSLR